jgi:TPR repeat protein/Flp pilus assembly protein TadD
MLPMRLACLLPVATLLLSVWSGSAAALTDGSEAAFRATLTKAQAGEAAAQYAVGDAYFDGAGVPKDLSEAMAWYRKAAMQGDRDAQYQLGRMYRYGEGTGVDNAQALAWYVKAAEQGLHKAVNDVGVMYGDGSAGQVDAVAARAWYLRAAEGGYGLAQLNVGRLLERGSGGAKDTVGALAWYRKAAGNGNADAHYQIGLVYFFGVGVPVDLVESARWFKLGAAAGSAAATERLGHMYLNGYGVESNLAQAVALFRQAVALGNQTASYQLAWCLENGDGVARDEAAAMALYVEGLALKDAFSRKQLVVMLEDGRGAPADPGRAAMLIAAMVADGDIDGLANLAMTWRERLQFDRADAMYAAALRAAEQRTRAGAKKSATVPLLTRYASLLILTGRFAEAGAMLRTALADEEADNGPRSPELGDPLEMLAYVETVGNRYSQAIALLERALSVLKENRRDTSGAATQLGAIALVQDRTQDAERHYRDARTQLYVAYPIGDRSFARNDANVAGLYIGQGKYAEAEQLLAHAVQAEISQPRPEPAELAGRLAGLGTVYLRQGRLDEAFTLSQRALHIAEKEVGGPRGIAALLTQLGTVELRRRHLPMAQDLLNRALAINERLTGPRSIDSAATLQALGELDMARGNLAQAESALRRAQAINEDILGPANSDVARNLDTLGQLYQARSDFNGAAAALTRAWTIRRSADISPQDKRATAIRLAIVYRHLQREPEALALDAWLQEHSEAARPIRGPQPGHATSQELQSNTAKPPSGPESMRVAITRRNARNLQ